MHIEYLQLNPGTKLPDIRRLKPFLTLLVIEEQVENRWRESVSQWLVKSGCLHMLSWGQDRASWDEAVDIANISQFEKGEIPQDDLILMMQQDQVPIEQFFKEAKSSATQDCVDFSNTLIVHIAKENKLQEFLSLYLNA